MISSVHKMENKRKPFFLPGLIAVVLLLNLFVSGWIYQILQKSRAQYREAAETVSQNMAHLLEHSIGGVFDKIDLSLQAASDEVSRQMRNGDIDGDALNAYLVRMRARTPELDGLRIANADGVIGYGTYSPREGEISVADQLYFRSLRNRQGAGAVVSDPHIDSTTGKSIIAVARRLQHSDGSFAGAVVGSIDLNSFMEIFSSLDIGSRGSINLRDANLRIMLRYPLPPSTESISEIDPVSEQLAEALRADAKMGTYVTVVPYDNVERTISYRRIDGWPLYVLVGVAADDYLAAWRRDAVNNIAMAIFFLLTSLMVAWLLYRNWKARTSVMEELDRQQKKFRSLAGMSSDWFWEQDSHFRFTNITRNPAHWSDESINSLIGKSCWELETAGEEKTERAESMLAKYKSLVQAHQPFENFEYRLRDESGKTRILSISGEPVFDERGTFAGYQGVGKDITGSREAEERERLLASMFRALSETNDAIIHAESEPEIFARVCKAAVEHGGMMHAWIGVPDKEGRSVPVASYGKAGALVDEITVMLEPHVPQGRGPSGIAFRERRPVIINDASGEESISPWHERTGKYGIKSIAAYPIVRNGQPYAVLVVYSDRTDAFDEEIVRLLKEMAGNISFALDNFDRENERLQSEIALRESERRFRMIADEAPFPLQIHAEDGQILRINRAWTTLSGYSLADTPTMRIWLEKSLGERAAKAEESIRDLFAQNARRDSGEYRIRCKDGSERIWHFFSSPLGNLPDGRRVFLSMAMDLTERQQAANRELQLKNIYQALSATNEAIIHAASEQALFPLLCRIAVEFGGMVLSWVGIPDQSGRFVPVASYGKAAGYLENITVLSDPDTPEGRGPSGVAFREMRPVVFDDMEKDEMAAPWREKAGQFGIRAAAALPILRNGNPYAIWAVYSDQSGAFDEETTRLLEEMAANISFAVHNLERESLRQQAQAALIESETKLRKFYESPLMGVVYWNRNGKVTDANDKYLEMIGYSRKELEAGEIDWISLTAPEYQTVDDHAIFELQATGFNNVPFEKEYIRRDGTRIPVMMAGMMLDGDNGVSFVIDVSERKKAEEELKLAAMVYQDSSEGMMVTDANNRIVSVNPAFERITGYSAEDAIGKPANMLLSRTPDENFYQSIRDALATKGYWKGELWSRRKNGQSFAIFITINTSFNPDGSINKRLILLSDITKKKETDELLWTQANFDALTGLPNRNLFRDHLRQEIRKARRNNEPLALMFLDLDGFKDVNDTMGHDMGDLLLKQAAERLQGAVREIDTVARLGGDEFTVILTELHDAANVKRVARNILKKLSEPFRLGEEIAHVSASIGITLYPDDAVGLEDLLKNADQAMYAAKQKGRNQYQYFTQSMQDAAQARMRLVNDLRGALESDQFELVYQPIVELSTGVIRKAEALIRWQHPARGMVNPAEFIPAAEDTGMINVFGDWVFHQAASQAAQWREKYHPDFQISVNISPVQFKKAGIDSTVWFDHLKNLGLPAQGIVVEITEGLLLEASTSVTDQLLALRDAGIEVALDDFGVGYSSLSYLKKFDIDYLKIDQAFVRNLAPGSSDMALCEAIIVMAHKLGLKVIAEGVETEKQRDLLAAAECDFAQGYLFSGPLGTRSLEKLLGSRPFATGSQSQVKS